MDVTVIKRSQCPKCLDSGHNNQVHYSDGHTYCFSCGRVSGKKSQQLNQPEEIEALPMLTTTSILAKRGISPDVIKRYGVQTLQTEDGGVWIGFPLHDINKAEYTQHLRRVDTSTGEMTRDMRYPKGSKLRLPLFGWQLVKKQATIVVCEGETDALILATQLKDNKNIAVLGMVGTANADKIAAHLLATITNQKVVLAFDNDKAGNEAVERIVATCERHESDIKLHRLDIHSDYKDVGDWLTNETVDILAEIETAPSLSLIGVLDSTAIANSLSEYIERLRTVSLIELQFSSTLSEAIRLLPGKLIGIAGASGQGKSTLAEHLVMEMLQQKKKVLFISREMMPEEIALKLLRMVRNEPLHDPRYLKTLDKETLAEIKLQVKNILKLLYCVEGYGAMEVAEVDKYIHKLTAEGNKPDLVVLDNLSAICKTQDSNIILEVCRDIKELAGAHQTCVVLLSHVRKAPPARGNKKTIYRPQEQDIYGSSGLSMFADVILAVASDKHRSETYVETIKVERMGGLYADVTLVFKDYCLAEVDSNQFTTDYQGDEEYDDDEEVY